MATLKTSLIRLLNSRTDGFDMFDYRASTLVGTAVLCLLPVLNLYRYSVPDMPFARHLLIGILLTTLLASYVVRPLKPIVNEIGNIYTLLYALILCYTAYLDGFMPMQTAFSMVILFGMTGLFRQKRYMVLYLMATAAFFSFLVLVSDLSYADKHFYCCMAVLVFGISGYVFYAKITAVQKLAQREKALKHSAARFRNIFDNAPVGIVLWDNNNKDNYVNAYFKQLTGLDEAHLRHSGLQNLVEPSDWPCFQSFVETAILAENSTEQRIKTKDGRFLWMRVSVTHNEQMGNWLTILMFSDISSRKMAEIHLEESAQQLKAQNAALEEFSYVISHDLQEPLRMITSFSQIIKRRYLSQIKNEEAESDFNFVIDGAKRMSNLIKDMLEYSRWSAKSFPTESVDTQEVLANVLDNLTVAIGQSKAKIKVSDLPKVVGNKMLLGQIWQNLIGNALKYSHPDRTPEIVLDIEKTEKETIFSVKDNGKGISKNNFERIFGIFQRLETDKQNGNGMGLAICKRLIEKQGGRIWVESEEGQGSTFFFTLPHVVEAARLSAPNQALVAPSV